VDPVAVAAGRPRADRREFLFRQAEPGTSLAVVLDGTFEVRVNGEVAG
jgi:hypothetical protein